MIAVSRMPSDSDRRGHAAARVRHAVVVEQREVEVGLPPDHQRPADGNNQRNGNERPPPSRRQMPAARHAGSQHDAQHRGDPDQDERAVVAPDRDANGDGRDVGPDQHDRRRRAGRDEGADDSHRESGFDQQGEGAVIPCAEPRLQSDGRQYRAQNDDAAQPIHLLTGGLRPPDPPAPSLAGPPWPRSALSLFLYHPPLRRLTTC